MLGYASMSPDTSRVATSCNLLIITCGDASLNLTRCQRLATCEGCLGRVKVAQRKKTHNEVNKTKILRTV